jgi:CheY-like chemotaxis protein
MSGSRRVLVVDDDEMLREVAKVALEMVGGWRVISAGSGPEAKSLALSEQPDALLLDVMMPGMDGAKGTSSGTTCRWPV